MRTPELLLELGRQHPGLCERLAPKRRLLDWAILADHSRLQRALMDEEMRERQADRLYWLPLRRELEALRHKPAPRS